MNKNNKTNEEILNRTHRFYQDKLSMEDMRAEERLGNTEANLKKQIAADKTTTEGRFTKLKSFNEVEQGKLRNYFDRATGSMKENFETSLRDMRDRNMRDQQALIQTFQKQAQENDAKLQAKITDVGVKYEKQIAEQLPIF
ncbi:MAG: hypothetical protein EOP05_17085 [Proteobacteria bacterium]|nr:MAG: hypothetical protein EOP05_17085 [Pseudomonadota bacterium]